MMEISVIIPTFNNAAMLATTLSAFDSVDIPEGTEFIVVDNNSTDGTAEIIKVFSNRLPVRYAFEPKQGISAAKNKGIRSAKGELLVFTDDDVRPCPEWLMTYLSAYRQNPKGMFWGGPIVSQFEGPEPDERLLRFAPVSVKGLDFGGSARVLEHDEWFVSANLAFTSHAVAVVGEFDTGLGLNPSAGKVLVGEETDFQRRLKSEGYRAMYLPLASLRHVVPARKCTLEHIANRAEATGRYLRAVAPRAEGAKTLRGVPLWRYRKCAERRFLTWIKRIIGRDWYADYIAYRAELGFLLGRSIEEQNRPK